MAHLYYVEPIHLDPKNLAIQTITFRADCRMRVAHRNRYRARRLDIRQFAVMKIKKKWQHQEIHRGDGDRLTFARQNECRVFFLEFQLW